MTENYSQPILNPNIYLNYLQPYAADGYEAARDVILVTLGALLWDILSSLPDDWTLIRTTRPSAVLFAYFSSRTCALVVAVMSMLAATGPVEDCGVIQLIICIFWILASASSSYLFLKRVHAVFLEDRLVCHTFTVLWIAGIGASTVLLPATLHDYHQIANTKHCINAGIQSYVAVAFFLPGAFDGLVFGAITYKIHKSHQCTTDPTNWKNFWVSRALPHFSRAVLQGGQQYYMITNSVNIACANVVLSPTPPVLQLLPLVPAVAVTSAMACRVFRNLRLEALRKTEVGNLTTIRFADKERVNVHLPRNTDVTSAEADFEEC